MNKQQNVGFALLLCGYVLSRYSGNVLSIIGVSLAVLGFVLACFGSRNVSKGFLVLGCIFSVELETTAIYCGITLGVIGLALLIWNAKVNCP